MSDAPVPPPYTGAPPPAADGPSAAAPAHLGYAPPSPAGSAAGSPAVSRRSPLSDGEWHRMHPLSPLMQGGVFLIAVIGILIANFRDRVIQLFLPEEARYDEGDPVDYAIDHGLILVGLGIALGIALVIAVMFYVSWRFHTFRITGDDVEVRRGVVFRSQRRAPLDRVQGVNLTRPVLARLVGLAKLEVVGAGTDANVKLEYLKTSDAETVRSDILRLASGAKLGERSAAAAGSGVAGVASGVAAGVSSGVTDLIEGVDRDEVEPESVVRIPVGRLILSRLLGAGTVWLLILAAAGVVASILWTPIVLVSLIPAAIGVVSFWIRSTTKSLRYSIAPTPSGVRITFGLFTTVTETLPPGRVHAVQIGQSLFWRGFGWWSITVTRMTGRAATDTRTDQFTTVLPVGDRADVERVLGLLLPGITPVELAELFDDGLLGPRGEDPFVTTPRRAWWLRPLSWRRDGYLLTPEALIFRRGFVWRRLGILPLARAQSIGLTQGPLGRALRIANLRVHTITGPVFNELGVVDRDSAVEVFADASAGAVAAVANDRSHRWAGQ